MVHGIQVLQSLLSLEKRYLGKVISFVKREHKVLLLLQGTLGDGPSTKLKLAPPISDVKVANFIIIIKNEKRNPGNKNREETEREWNQRHLHFSMKMQGRKSPRF